jgi:hypothetical protein
VNLLNEIHNWGRKILTFNSILEKKVKILIKFRNYKILKKEEQKEGAVIIAKNQGG